MRVQKRFFLLILLFLVILSACQGPGGEVTNSDTDDKKALTLWHISTGGAKDTIENAVARFEENNPNVKVEVVQQENDPYKTKLSVAMGGGTPPDVFHSWGGGWLQNFVGADQVKEITRDVEADKFLEAGLSTTTFEEKIYGVPLGMSVVPIWYNKDIFEKYDLEEPKTYDELISIIETLKSKDIVPFGLANQTKWPGAMYLMYLAERIGGPDLFDEAYNRERGFDDKAYIEAGQKVQDLVNIGAFPNGMNGMDYDSGQSRQLMYTDKAAMMVQVSNFLNNVRDEYPEFEDKLGFFLFPKIEGGKGETNHLVGGVSPAFSVSKKSGNQDLAVELMKELTSEETANEYVDHAGGISAVKGVKYEDELVGEISKVLEESNFMQTFYDQSLPPELATVHLDTTQALFGLSITPEEAAEKVEAKAQELLE